MATAVVKGQLPASFIPVEFSIPTNRRASSASSSSRSSISLSSHSRDLVQLLEPSYRYLLRPGSKPSRAIKIADVPDVDSSGSMDFAQSTSDMLSATYQDSLPERKVARKGKAYRSPPLEPTLSAHDSALDGCGSSGKPEPSAMPGIVDEPLAYVGTINYEFILSACQTVSQASDSGSNRSPPRNGDSSSQRNNSSRNGKRKSSASKGATGIWDWKGKGNTRSAKESPAKAKKAVPAQNIRVREPSEEPVTRSRSTRSVRASSQQRLQRNKSAETVSVSQRTSPAPASTSSARNKSTEPKSIEDSSGKVSTSLVPPPNASTHLPPPSPLRQSAIPVRLAEKLATVDSSPLDAPMTRSASLGGGALVSSDTAIPATRGLKRRQSSAGPSFEGGEDEGDVSKRLRRALAASIPVHNPSLLTPGSPKRASRSTRPTTRYATRSAPNSPPREPAVLLDAPNLDATPPPVSRGGRAGLRRTMSHDTLPEGEDVGTKSGLSVDKNDSTQQDSSI